MQFISASYIRSLAVVLTVAVMMLHYLLPAKQLVIHPEKDFAYSIYSDGDQGGESIASWIDKQKTLWQCELKPSAAHPVCGLAVHLGTDEANALNAEGFDRVKIQLRYAGPGQVLRVYIRNFDGKYGVAQDRDTHKFMYVNIPTTDFGSFEKKYVTDIALTEFQVADWWRDEYKVDRNSSKPRFDSVTSFGVDFPFPQVMGVHKLELVKVELIGTWIKSEVLYLGIILTWLAALFCETTVRMYRWRKLARENLRQVKDLTDYAKELRLRSEKYRELSHIDNLTEVFNRYGFMQTLKSLFGKEALNGCLMIIDIDHFKAVNDQFGHVQGDKVLLEVAQLIAKNIRKSDIFARWGGEEFVLLVTHYSLDQAKFLAEKLSALIAEHQFDIKSASHVTVSIGLTSFSKLDSLNSAFLRADEALYQAKSQGRNRVVVI